MSIRIVRLGEKRAADEGTRIGTVRRPPRGVARRDFARLDYYDVWLPLLAPSPDTLKAGLAVRNERDWAAFARKYRAEMRAPEARQALDVLAALSRQANFSVGCYCQDERHCHRSLLRGLLLEHGAEVQS